MDTSTLTRHNCNTFLEKDVETLTLNKIKAGNYEAVRTLANGDVHKYWINKDDDGWTLINGEYGNEDAEIICMFEETLKECFTTVWNWCNRVDGHGWLNKVTN